MTPSLEVLGVTKRFGDVTAVDDVSFRLGPDELLALVGPSGCGKSTLLRIIAGLHRADAGSISLAGVGVVDDEHTTLPPERRRVGLVFQEHALFPHLSVSKNVAFGVGKGTAADARVAEMLDVVGLDGFGERYPHELSGGERQRVALARALAPQPALMLLDEPFASLDPNLRSRIRDDVVAILRATSTPAVFVTHDQPEALAIGDRIAVMRGGRVVQLDDPTMVFHSPADRFVGAFMGEADFLTAATARADFATPLLSGVDDDRLVMLRPDDVTFTADGSGRAEVIDAEFRGSSWCYTLRLDSGAAVHSTRSHLVHVDVGTTVTAMIVDGHEPVVIPR
ncbi:MAG: ABC transporter ATP-binding protein [Ilumatobacteraceae bacterium]